MYNSATGSTTGLISSLFNDDSTHLTIRRGMIVAVVPQVAQMRSTDTAADFINNVDKNSLPSTLDLFGFKLLYSSN